MSGGIFFDKENQLSSSQAFTGSATVTDNSYEKQTAAQDISIGRRMALVFFATVAAGAGSTTKFDVIQADDGALTTNKEVLGSVSLAAAAIKVGQPIEVPIPQGVMTRKYLGGQVTITSGTTTGTYDCYLVPQDEIPKFKAFPKVVDALV